MVVRVVVMAMVVAGSRGDGDGGGSRGDGDGGGSRGDGQVHACVIQTKK